MNANICKILVSGLGALIIAGALASTPAQAKGGGGGGGGHFGGFFGGLSDIASSYSDNSDSGSGTVAYANTPTYSYTKPCHNENRPLYDDNDKVVAHQVVMVCPAK
jgi:hypothetical protein